MTEESTDQIEFIEHNQWTTLDGLDTIVKKMIYPILEYKWGKSAFLQQLRKPSGGYHFRIIVLPVAGQLRFFVSSGSTVVIQIRGLSFFGGTGILIGKGQEAFWNQLYDVLHHVNKLRHPSDLVPSKTYERAGQRKLRVTKENPFPDLLPEKEIEVIKIMMEITAQHKVTGATVRFHQPLDFVPSRDVVADARVKLSLLVNEWNKEDDGNEHI